MVFSPSAGADEALGPFVFRIINILSICQFLVYLFPLNDMLTVFPIQMHWQPMLTMSSNRSRSPQGHALYTHCSTLAINASCQVSLKSVHRFRRKNFFKGFYHIQVNLIITLSLGSMKTDRVISEPCYNEVIFNRHIVK